MNPSESEPTVRLRYVGLKPQETDCVAGTFITWVGWGDIREVPARCWPIMARHPDVWELVAEPDSETPADTTDKTDETRLSSVSSVGLADAPRRGRPPKAR
jgi:hypothetical protein